MNLKKLKFYFKNRNLIARYYYLKGKYMFRYYVIELYSRKKRERLVAEIRSKPMFSTASSLIDAKHKRET